MTSPARPPLCIICWTVGRTTPATVFVDPGWYCTDCAAQPLRDHAFRRGMCQGLTLALTIAVVAVLIGVLVAYAGSWVW